LNFRPRASTSAAEKGRKRASRNRNPCRAKHHTAKQSVTQKESGQGERFWGSYSWNVFPPYDHDVVVEEGGFLFKPRGIVHTVWNPTDVEVIVMRSSARQVWKISSRR
jgi:hypothetical protein